MGRESFLIDTNIIIEYFGDTLPENAISLLDEIIDRQFYLSVINKIELLGFAGLRKQEEEKFREFVNAAIIPAFNDEVINLTIDIRKNYRIKLPDAIIAATAMVNGLTLISRNTKDFEKVKKLKIMNPHVL